MEERSWSFGCSYCSSSFPTQPGLKAHEKLEHAGAAQKPEQRNAAEVAEEIRMEGGYVFRPYICGDCGKGVDTLAEAKVHDTRCAEKPRRVVVYNEPSKLPYGDNREANAFAGDSPADFRRTSGTVLPSWAEGNPHVTDEEVAAWRSKTKNAIPEHLRRADVKPDDSDEAILALTNRLARGLQFRMLIPDHRGKAGWQDEPFEWAFAGVLRNLNEAYTAYITGDTQEFMNESLDAMNYWAILLDNFAHDELSRIQDYEPIIAGLAKAMESEGAPCQCDGDCGACETGDDPCMVSDPDAYMGKSDDLTLGFAEARKLGSEHVEAVPMSEEAYKHYKTISPENHTDPPKDCKACQYARELL